MCRPLDLIKCTSYPGGRQSGVCLLPCARCRRHCRDHHRDDNHPVWSVDRQEWVPLAELAQGEGLCCDTESLGLGFPSSLSPKACGLVLSVSLSRVSQPVYNIEVHGEHVYQVGELGLVVHNVKGGLVPTGAKRLGKWGEDRLEALLGITGIKPKNPFFTSMGTRYVDRLINGVAHESKAGAHWHFWQGATKELLETLTANGIKYTVY